MPGTEGRRYRRCENEALHHLHTLAGLSKYFERRGPESPRFDASSPQRNSFRGNWAACPYFRCSGRGWPQTPSGRCGSRLPVVPSWPTRGTNTYERHTSTNSEILAWSFLFLQFGIQPGDLQLGISIAQSRWPELQAWRSTPTGHSSQLASFLGSCGCVKKKEGSLPVTWIQRCEPPWS